MNAPLLDPQVELQQLDTLRLANAPEARDLLQELLARLTHERATATIMATHSAEAAAICDTIVKLRDGSVEEVVRR